MLADRLKPGGVPANPDHPGLDGRADRSVAAGADAAHELANLMMVLLGSLEQLRRQPLDEAGHRQLGRAEWSARQAARLTRHVLSRAQGRDNRAELVDLNAVVDGFATIMGQEVEGFVRFVVVLAPGPLPVRLDAGLLELVLLNLMRNATDAMPAGGKVTVRTRGPRLDGLGNQLTAELSVSDTGTGMPPAVARRATEAFFTTKQDGKGTGLGLWMAQRFAAEAGGKVEIETALGHGTTVRLAFPYVAEAEQD